MKQCWNETGKEKPKYWEINFFQCHFFQNKPTGTGLDSKLAVRDERKLTNSDGNYTD
jgi:hypothetical protein